MDEERRHLVIGVGHQRVLPQDNGTQHRTIGKAEAGSKESSTEVGRKDGFGDPQVDEDEEVREVAEVQEEELKVKLVVGVAPVRQEQDSFLSTTTTTITTTTTTTTTTNDCKTM